MIDIFDAVLPPARVAIGSATSVVLAAAAHRLVPAFVLFLACAVVLLAVSADLRRGFAAAGTAAGTGQGNSASTRVVMVPAVRAYDLPLVQVVSADSLKVVLLPSTTLDGRDTHGKSLMQDVSSGLVNTLLLGGTTWVAHTDLDTLVLTRRTVPTCPVQVLSSGAADWTTDSRWASGAGVGALVLAFRDDGVAA